MFITAWCNIVIMFKPYLTYTHRNCLDVNIVVQKSFSLAKGYKLKVSWFTKSGTFLSSDEIFVKREHVKNWSQV